MALRDLMKGTINPELKEGEHKVVLHGYEYKAHAEDEAKDYIRMSFTTEHGAYNRNMFEKDVAIMVSHLRKQLGRAEEAINPLEFFEGLVKDQTAFTIHIQYVEVPTARGLRTVQNLFFLPPLPKTAPTATASKGMEIPS